MHAKIHKVTLTTLSIKEHVENVYAFKAVH